MLKEEVDLLLTKTESELVELITFIKSVEHEVNRSIGRKCDPQNSKSENQFSDSKNGVGGAATNDAFLIVENALLRICNLLNQLSSLTIDYEESTDIHTERYYYALYVYRIASYFVEIIKINLEIFYNKLRKLASPSNSDEDEEFDFNKTKSIPIKQDIQPKGNLPIRWLKLKSDILRHLYWLYEQPRIIQCPCKHKQSSEISTTNAENNLQESKYCVHSQSKFSSVFSEKKEDNFKARCKRNTDQDCFSGMCSECQDLYQENVEPAETELRFLDSEKVDNLTNKPFWMTSDSKQSVLTKPLIDSLKQNRTKYYNSTESKNLASTVFRTQNTEDHGTQTFAFDVSPTPTENVIKSDDSLETKYFECHKPHKKTMKTISTGILKSPLSQKDLPLGLTCFRTKNEQIEKSQRKCESYTETDDVELVERKIKDDRNVQPLFLKDLKEKFITSQGGFDGFRLFPGISSFSEQKVNILAQKTNDHEKDSPRAFIFDINKCSTLLKEKFKVLLEQSSERSESDEEPLRILDIVFDSIGGATDVYAKRDEMRSDVADCDKEEIDYLKEVLNRATQAMATDSDETSDEIQSNLTDAFATTVRNEGKKLLTKKSHKGGKHSVISYACATCQTMIKPPACQVNNFHSCTEKCLVRESLRSSCYTCMNGRQRGWTIHQCHNSLPKGLLEIRHMDDTGKVCVCFLFWNRRKQQDDWRWQKNPFHDPTRVEIEQETDLGKNAILRVIFGPEGTMLKQSLATSQLPLVCDSAKYPDVETHKMASAEKKSSASTDELHKKHRKVKLTYDDSREQKFRDNEKKLLTKLGRFFNDIQKVGYGEGPPLVLKLRKELYLHDAYDLFTVLSKIRLNYYRSLRIVFIADFDSKVGPSATNFQKEDEISELFELFERQLFSSTGKSLFVYPSQESRCIYFNPDPNTQFQWFAFAGIVVALAILHQKKLHVKFPLCLFKCLLDRAVNIQDLKEIDPMVYQKLMWIKENNITNHCGMLTFTIKDKIGDRTYEDELVVNGSKISVTEENKFRYIDLAVKWKLAERYLTQLKEFRRGFASVIDPCFLTNFTEKELRSLIMHPPNPDIFLKRSSSEELPREILRRETL